MLAIVSSTGASCSPASSDHHSGLAALSALSGSLAASSPTLVAAPFSPSVSAPPDIADSGGVAASSSAGVGTAGAADSSASSSGDGSELDAEASAAAAASSALAVGASGALGGSLTVSSVAVKHATLARANGRHDAAPARERGDARRSRANGRRARERASRIEHSRGARSRRSALGASGAARAHSSSSTTPRSIASASCIGPRATSSLSRQQAPRQF